MRAVEEQGSTGQIPLPKASPLRTRTRQEAREGRPLAGAALPSEPLPSLALTPPPSALPGLLAKWFLWRRWRGREPST